MRWRRKIRLPHRIERRAVRRAARKVAADRIPASAAVSYGELTSHNYDLSGTENILSNG